MYYKLYNVLQIILELLNYSIIGKVHRIAQRNNFHLKKRKTCVPLICSFNSSVNIAKKKENRGISWKIVRCNRSTGNTIIRAFELISRFTIELNNKRKAAGGAPTIRLMFADLSDYDLTNPLCGARMRVDSHSRKRARDFVERNERRTRWSTRIFADCLLIGRKSKFSLSAIIRLSFSTRCQLESREDEKEKKGKALGKFSLAIFLLSFIFEKKKKHISTSSIYALRSVSAQFSANKLIRHSVAERNEQRIVKIDC